MADTKKLYPRTGDKQTVYLKNVITDPAITVGDYTTVSYTHLTLPTIA